MKRILLAILFFSFTVSAAQDIESISKDSAPLESFSKAVESGQYDQARKLLIDESLNEDQLKQLKTVFDKVLKYIEYGIITPTREGSKQISLNLRGSVIFLLEEDDKLYFTKGTTSNIPELLEMAELLSTPEKTMAYYIEKVKVKDLEEASTCFVKNDKKALTEEEASHFAEVLKGIIKKEIEGQYQGKTQKSLVSYKMGDYSVSLAKESGDWLFTLHTRKHIPTLYNQAKQNTLKGIGPPTLHEKLFLIKNWQWLGIIVILLAGIIIQWLFQIMFRKTVAKKLQLTGDEANTKNFRSITILCVSLCWYLLFPLLGIDKDTVVILTNAAAIMAMVSALFVASRILDFFKEVLQRKASETDNKVDDVLIPMFHKLAKMATVVIGLVLIASNIGINVASLLAGIGLAGMAFALAAKDTVENIFGSVTVLLDKPFEVGDFVSVGGVDGIVEQIGLRSTRIRTFYCSQVNVPNSTLIKATVDNYGRRNFRRIKTTLSMTYDTPPDKIEAFCEGVRELIRKHPFTRKDSYHVYFTEFNTASLDVLLLCYIDTGDYAIELRERQRLFIDIIRLAGRLGVEFAFPTQTLHMAKPEDLSKSEEETDLKKINNAVLEGRELSNKIMSESLPDKNLLPPEIDYYKGNVYSSKDKS